MFPICSLQAIDTTTAETRSKHNIFVGATLLLADFQQTLHIKICSLKSAMEKFGPTLMDSLALSNLVTSSPALRTYVLSITHKEHAGEVNVCIKSS